MPSFKTTSSRTSCKLQAVCTVFCTRPNHSQFHSQFRRFLVAQSFQLSFFGGILNSLEYPNSICHRDLVDASLAAITASRVCMSLPRVDVLRSRVCWARLAEVVGWRWVLIWRAGIVACWLVLVSRAEASIIAPVRLATSSTARSSTKALIILISILLPISRSRESFSRKVRRCSMRLRGGLVAAAIFAINP